jgi:AcrR family transcriptional regulator
MDLFRQRGFDDVRVAEIARRADVSEATVFNYFRTKEDLVYSGLEDFWSRALSAVAARPVGVTVLEAFRRFLLAQPPAADTAEQQQRLVLLTRMITGSPALRARERQAYDEGAKALAEVIAQGRVPSPEDRVTAYALVGVHRVVVDDTRVQILAGAYGSGLAARTAEVATRAFATLEAGLPS